MKIGKNGRILNNRAYYGAVYINGTDEHLDIYGKINGNICANRGGGVVLSNNGGNHNATMYEGAEICNNKAEQTGGGTMISKGIFTMAVRSPATFPVQTVQKAKLIGSAAAYLSAEAASSL